MNQAMLDQAHVYTDFSGLNALKSQARHDKDAALKEVAKQFESLFISMMLKSMRDANKPLEEGNFLHSAQSDFYRDMFDSQLSLSLSKGSGLGLADTLYRQLAKQSGQQETDPSYSLRYHSISDYPRELPAPARAALEAVEEVSALVSEIERAQHEPESDAPVLGTGKVMPSNFDSPQAFIEHLYPAAKAIELESGIDARFLLAQSALETGWGKHMIEADGGLPSFNLFGIKADQRWQGERVEITTTEYREGVALKEKAEFRAYASFEDSFRDYVDFIQSNQRYSEALKVKDKPELFIEQLHKAGYATDPDYSQKVQRIFNSDLLQSALQVHQG